MWSHKMGLQCSCRKGLKREGQCILSLSCFSGKRKTMHFVTRIFQKKDMHFVTFTFFRKKTVFCHFHIFVGSRKSCFLVLLS